MRARKELEKSLAMAINAWANDSMVHESEAWATNTGWQGRRLDRLAARAAIAVLMAGREGERLGAEFGVDGD